MGEYIGLDVSMKETAVSTREALSCGGNADREDDPAPGI
jgi:hypothetical protein